MMQYYKSPNNNIKSYPQDFELRSFFKRAEESNTYIPFSHLIGSLQVLPASEAAAERIFARMRDVYNQKQARLHPETLRTNLILSFYAE